MTCSCLCLQCAPSWPATTDLRQCSWRTWLSATLMMYWSSMGHLHSAQIWIMSGIVTMLADPSTHLCHFTLLTFCRKNILKKKLEWTPSNNFLGNKVNRFCLEVILAITLPRSEHFPWFLFWATLSYHVWREFTWTASRRFEEMSPRDSPKAANKLSSSETR